MRKFFWIVLMLAVVLSSQYMAWRQRAAGMALNHQIWVGLALAGAFGLVLALGALLAPHPAMRRSVRNLPRVGMATGLLMVAVSAFTAVIATAYFRLPWPRLAMADYMLAYLLVMALVILALRVFWPREFGFPVATDPENDLGGLGRAVLLFLGFVGAMGTVIHMNLTNFMPNGYRLFLMLPVAVIVWLYTAQEEGLKRAVSNDLGPWAGLVVGLAGKLLILATWAGAVALPNPPAFLPLTFPAALGASLLLEVLSYVLTLWRYPAGGVAAFSSLVLAWVLAVTMPLS